MASYLLKTDKYLKLTLTYLLSSNHWSMIVTQRAEKAKKLYSLKILINFEIAQLKKWSIFPVGHCRRNDRDQGQVNLKNENV